MCNPVVIGIAGLAVSVAGGLLNAKGTADKAASDQEYYNHLADVADENAVETRKTGEYDRSVITKNSGWEMQSNKTQTELLMGTQAVTAAANGTGMGSVTSADIMRDTLNKSTLDEMYIRYNADTQKYLSAKKENQDVKNLREQAKGYRAGGEAAKAAGNLAVAGGLLNTAGQVASQYYNYTKKG